VGVVLGPLRYNIYKHRLVFLSARYATRRTGKAKNFARLIIFIVGGVFMSEIRSAYEVTEKFGTWEVIIGKYLVPSP
jgi:hypothetical protein